MSSPAGSKRAARAEVVLRVLRRTHGAGAGIEDVLTRLMNDVHPDSEDLVEALATAQRLPDGDPARAHLVRVLERAIDSRVFTVDDA